MIPTVNVASYLAAMAGKDPNRAAVIVPRTGEALTFRELHEDSDILARGLVTAGITRGQHAAVMVPPSLEFFSLIFALFKAAVVPVMIDPGMGMRNLGRCLEEAEPKAFIGIAKAHIARRMYGWAKGSMTVNAGRSRFFCHHSTGSLRKLSEPGALVTEEVAADETAAILFTSGSTGLAKGVVYTHGIFAAQVEMLKQVYGIEPGEVDLCTFPLFALFGPALGMTCIVPTMDFARPATIDAARTVRTIEKYHVTNLFGSPAVINRLGEYWPRLPSLNRAISAGAPARLDVVEQFAAQLDSPPGEIFTPYGATEALPVANIGSVELLATKSLHEAGHGLCIGRPVPGVTVHVIPIRDDAVPDFDTSLCLSPGQIGEFVVRGPIVTKSYWKRDDATRIAKMHDPLTGETLHRMGDVGYFDDQGRLWFCGRKSQRVVTAYNTLFTDQVEPIFNCIDHIYRTALVGVKVGMTVIPVICVERVSSANSSAGVIIRLPHISLEDLITTLRSRAASNAITTRIEHFLDYRGSFPMDPRHNSKINREKLALWAAKQLKRKA